ncbi:4383_t:CDS:2 [Entrophospora sp. SA101]|nr:4383_t:CDS:2 [Entrophospora sp. SA101]
MKYYENGNLYQYLNYVKGVISWRDMIDMLWDISCGLEKIHSQDLFHGNLHGGNLLIEEENVSTDAKLADVGFYGPVNFSKAEDERWKLISRQHNKSYTPPKQHPQAFYTSREFYFPNLTNQ